HYRNSSGEIPSFCMRAFAPGRFGFALSILIASVRSSTGAAGAACAGAGVGVGIDFSAATPVERFCVFGWKSSILCAFGSSGRAAELLASSGLSLDPGAAVGDGAAPTGGAMSLGPASGIGLTLNLSGPALTPRISASLGLLLCIFLEDFASVLNFSIRRSVISV